MMPRRPGPRRIGPEPVSDHEETLRKLAVRDDAYVDLLLSTHLSFREIGERLFVSRNTIKTQAISVYRKLGVSSRSDAIARAAELGLVEASVGNGAPGPAGDVQSAAS